MNSTLLVAGAGNTVGAIVSQAVRAAAELIGGPPGLVLTLPADTEAAVTVLRRSDLVVVVSALTAGGMDDDLRRLLDRQRAGSWLSGVTAFAVTIGGWPLAADVVNSQLRPALQAAGAACLAPGLHLTSSPGGPDRVLTSYAGFWRPAIGTLIRIGQHDRARAA